MLTNIFTASSILNNIADVNKINQEETVLEFNNHNAKNGNKIPISQSRWYLSQDQPTEEDEAKTSKDSDDQINYIKEADDDSIPSDAEAVTTNYIVNASEEHKVYFHDLPEESTKRKAYINSPVKIFIQKIENGYGYVEFTNIRGQKSIGWLNMEDLALIDKAP